MEMYNKLDTWGHNKHSTTGYAAGHNDTDKSGSGSYQSSDSYNSGSPEEKMKGMYGSNEPNNEEKEKIETGWASQLDETIEKETRREEQEEEQSQFQQLSNNIQTKTPFDNQDDTKKKKKNSIEEAIDTAIQQEKKTIHLNR